MKSKVFVDLDGTIAGYSGWEGFLVNTFSIFKPGLLFNPDNYFSEWYLLTSRPKIDLPLIVVFCFVKRLNPKSIITCNQWFWNQTCIIRKVDFLRNQSTKYKVLYLDSDQLMLSMIGSDENLVSMSPEQFLRQFDEQILTKVGDFSCPKLRERG